MPSLIETYARSTGLKIDTPWLKEDFYPLPFTKYITIASGSNQGAKNYDFWTEVIAILAPYLSAQNYSIVLLGGKDDPMLPGTHDLRAKTTYAQSYYLLRQAALHVGCDSWSAHAAAWSKIPLVALYGSTDSIIHGPFWRDKEKTILIESHRLGRKPSFTSQENPKMVNFIDPYDVARAVLKLLKIDHTLTQKTQYIGGMYPVTVIEWVPNCIIDPNFNKELPFVARMDKHHDENALIQTLQSGRKVHLFAKTPITQLGIFQAFKDSILSYSHEIDTACPAEYVKALKKLFPKTSFFSRIGDAEALSKLRFQFFDYTMIDQAIDTTREDYFTKNAEYLNVAPNSVDKEAHIRTLQFKTNKYVLANGKIYLSHAHAKVDLPADGNTNFGPIIDIPEFWCDLHHLNCYLN